MSDLISREALLEELEAQDYYGGFLVRLITNAPAIEQGEPVVIDSIAAGIINGKRQTLPMGATYYTAPQKQQWVGLNDDEIDKMWEFYRCGWYDFAMAIEAKLKELNHDTTK